MLTMMKNSRGFTLPEVLVAMAVGMVILTAIYAAVISGQRASGAIQRKVTTFQDARAALELMATEIQMASYNPNLTTVTWRAANACNSPSGQQNNRGIQAADPNFITIEMDIDGTGALMDHTDEIITYTYLGNAANLRITRETNCGGAQPFLGGPLADGSITTRVMNDINTNGSFDAGDIPVFRYFNGSGAEILPASLPTHISDIARIEIALVVETQDIDPDMHQRRRMIYSTSVIPRNHALSQ
jgi:prepilin-type N-terminal cleavage/methylation domain-containing protein